jgi:hypothetical protein
MEAWSGRDGMSPDRVSCFRLFEFDFIRQKEEADAADD